MKSKFENTGFAEFMASPAGRITRVVAGLGLMIWASTQVTSNRKATLLAIGSIPLSAGAFDFVCCSLCLEGIFGAIKSGLQTVLFQVETI